MAAAKGCTSRQLAMAWGGSPTESMCRLRHKADQLPRRHSRRRQRLPEAEELAQIDAILPSVRHLARACEMARA
jgi:hypothetical protein